MRTPARLRRLALACATTLGLALGTVPAHAQTPPTPTPHCLWYSAGDSQTPLTQYATDSHTVTQVVSLKKVNVLAMNGSDCGVWAVSDKQLTRFDANAVQLWSASLKSLGNKPADVSQAIADPVDNALWLTDEKSLTKIATTGQVLLTVDLPSDIKTFTLAADQSLWAIGKKTLVHYSPQGQLLATLNLHKLIDDKQELIAVDALAGVVWLGKDKRLTQFRLAALNDTPLQQRLPDEAISLALNPLDSTLWVLTEKKLLAYSPAGQPGVVIDLKPLGLKDVQKVGVDPVSKTLWVSAKKSLSQFSAEGNFLRSLTGKDTDGDFAAPAFLLTPTLSKVRPAGLSNNPTPTIAYAYGALCNGQDCGWTAERYAGFGISATLDQAAIGPFVFEAGTGQTSTTLATPLSEGPHTLTAQASDGLGHVSATVTDSFTLDTTPPKFLSLTPAEGTTTTTAATTIQGQVDDTQANIILNHQEQAATAAQTPDGTGRFSFPVTLKEGSNRIDLTAWDRANNSAKASLHLNLSLAPTFRNLTPPTGTQLTTPQVTISGSVNDPAAAVTLIDAANWNATGANPAGQNFSWTVTLKPGANTLRMTATNPAGTSTSAELSLSYIPPPPAAPLVEKIAQSAVSQGQVTITGSAGASLPGIQVNLLNPRSGQSATVIADAQGGFSANLGAQDGDLIAITVQDAWAQSSPAVSLTVDALPPAFLNVTPATGTQVSTPQVTISGSVDDPSATVTLLDAAGWNAIGTHPAGPDFSWEITLQPGDNAVRLESTDGVGNTTTQVLNLSYIPPPPATPMQNKVALGTVSNGQIIVTGSAGATLPGLQVTVINQRSQQSVSVTADDQGGFIATIAVENGDGLAVSVLDAWGQSSASLDLTVKTEAMLYFIESDALGTPRRVRDQAGTVVWQNLPTAEAFGADAPVGDGAFELPLGFAGQYRDKETGLNYNFYRDYDPQTGRYVQSDPIGLAGGSFSTYTYVNGNPVSGLDPKGLELVYEKDGVKFHANPKPDGGSNYGEHTTQDNGRTAYHVHVNDDPNKRWDVTNNKPLDEDEANFTKKEMKVCKSLTEGEQRYLNKATREVFHHHPERLARLKGRYLSGPLGVLITILTTNSYEESCSRDYLDELGEVCN